MMFSPPPRLDFAGVKRPAFGSSRRFLEPAIRHNAKAEASYQRAARTAAEVLPELPRPGESIHCIILSYADLMQVIAATVNRLPQCLHLRAATLAMSRRNSGELVGLLESKKVLSLTLLVSEFFKAHNKELFESIQAELSAFPNVKIAAARNHAKVTTFETAESAIVFESSANLRSNRSREFLTVFNDRQLFDFHSKWIDELANHGQEEKPQAGR
jgi:hypothetical protein